MAAGLYEAGAVNKSRCLEEFILPDSPSSNGIPAEKLCFVELGDNAISAELNSCDGQWD